MYLSHEAHKLFTVALVALGGVVSRPATDAVKKGSQIADRFLAIGFRGNKKGLDSSVFTICEKH